ncbi:Uu.00g129850.m01.CDS01 [Anthostomella pinea]|uniref:Uu.00g129850.m01.CDS01 n=1 Tax=Anthostomella pinea TaxID=933095 RepID=A0AAI8VJA9_9PEZI|nr:Uu.00g129850.m01.CDS01 [Anthostomella pinea]
MTSARDTTSQLRQTLNPLLTTSLGGHNNHSQTPHSAVSISSYHTFGPLTPASSVQPYNPQEWAPSPAVVPERTHQFTPPSSLRDTHAPPPYSPPRSQRPSSIVYETPPANISAARVPASSIHRPSPDPQNNQSFPPPPGTPGRGPSRERRFGLPSLTRRRERDQTESTVLPDAHPPLPRARPQTLMIHVPPQAPEISNADIPIIPPTARRAVSASAIETPTSARSRSITQSRWGTGMALPPPPPGPPPSSQSRSQSLNRTTDPVLSPPTRRPPPGGVTALGPVPPTPADWIDDEPQTSGGSPENPGLTIDTTNTVISRSPAAPEPSSDSSPSSGGLSRNGAVRGEKTLRERRNDSRTRHQRADSTTDTQHLSNIVVPQGANLTRRFSVHRGTPRSGGTPRIGEDNTDSRHSTPRLSASLHPETPTPLFSPHPQKARPGVDLSHSIAPRALPTPPPQSRSASSSSNIRHDLYSSISSLTSAPTSCQPLTKQAVVSQTAEQFCLASIERYQVFAGKEASAKSDADRVKLFADFIVNESRLRRERYTSSIGAMGSEIFDLTRDLFRPMKVRRDSSTSQCSEWTPQMSETKSHRNSLTSVFRDQIQSNSAPASANLPPDSPVSGSANGNWTSNQYMPSLSPILSMSVSEALDGTSSRGRPASRWWEAESAGESSRLERTKRESKYMGVPKEAREALQWQDTPGSSDSHAGPSDCYSGNEYPPEKTGWHESEHSNTPQPFRQSLISPFASSAPNTPSPSHLDISRLVTLPPPYPRHHPAVNNNHPELTEIRILVRSVSDVTEVQATKERFAQETQKARHDAAQAASSRRQSLRKNLQQEISSGNMSYAEAGAIEADSQETEKAQAKELERKEFERFQNVVIMPLNEQLTGRIAQATSLFDELRSRLFVETQAPNPNMPQEEGDEQPELLEKLTLLKWIFEAREMLHREIYDLLSDRNDRYKEMVITPYRLSGNEDKLQNAEAFFAEDASKRRAAFTNEVLQRTREFRGVVEENAIRGVDMQLNAFWDIAPPLKRLLDKIPASLDNFRIQIPPSEFDENPVYHKHPLQYLYSLLMHAEKSTYQFIESQTNLLCLLHEVKEAVMGARAKVSEAEGRDPHTVEEERKGEQHMLTDDLKEKVRVVQDQWESAIGDGMRGVKERVGEWLLSTGGWDESLEDRGVGGS